MKNTQEKQTEETTEKSKVDPHIEKGTTALKSILYGVKGFIEIFKDVKKEKDEDVK